MEAPLSAARPASATGTFVALDDDGAACWHWRAKGTCRYGAGCARASTHVPIDGPPRGLNFMLYKTPREEAPQCLFRRTMTRNGLGRTKEPAQAHLFWANILPAVSGNSLATNDNTLLRKLSPHCRANHFPRSFEITHKDKLYLNMRLHGPPQQDSFLPRSFVLPDEAVSCHAEVAAVAAREGPDNSIWIMKPVGLGEGRGIQVLRMPSLADLTPPTPYAIQRYIARPLLLPLNRRKFDLRIYVLALGWEPHPHVLLYREGLVRFAAVEYVCTGETLKDLAVHLCNNAVNRKVDEKTNSKNWTLSQLRDYLDKEPGFEGSFAYLWDQIRYMAVNALKCASCHIAPALAEVRQLQGFKGHCFELFGMDVLIDEERRAWLCEVNHMPDIGCTSRKFSHIYKSDFSVKSRLLADLLNILFPNGAIEASPLAATQLGNFEILDLNMPRPTAPPRKP